MTKIEMEDIRLVAELPYKWDHLTNKTLLVSGGTGFIGSFLCNVIRYRNKKYNQHIKVISVAFSAYENDDTVTYIKRDICQPIDLDIKVDYILHLASNTHPLQYKLDPVGTITGNVFGCYNLLMFAKERGAKRFVLASSCEIYGDGKDTPMDELYCGYINSNSARAGYNEAKRVSEALCQSFAQQYGIESCVFRLARVFGPDRTKKDTKAMAQFIYNVVKGQDIILKSNGLTDEKIDRIYYLQLAVNALWSIFFFLLKWRLFSFLWIILLAVLVIIMIIRFYNKNKAAGLLQIPYILWILFASYLNLGTYLLNR